jgi:hypothetical protein
MIPENKFNDPVLEQAVMEIREEPIDPAVIEAAAARVWAGLASALEETPAATGAQHLRACADYQALIPAFRAGTLPEARALLVKDHLHECVACRRVYEGRVVSMPSAPRPAARPRYVFRWAAAAVVLIGAGFAVWYTLESSGALVGRPIVQAVSGTLYLAGADGALHTLAVNQDLPDNAEIRTAKDSDAFLRLRDGSVVELRERSSFSTSHAAADITVHLGRGSVIVEAAKRRAGHLYVDTADCRVAVTGTIFSVSAGVKGSRVSVVQGEVHVTDAGAEKVLHPGDQTVTGEGLEPVLVKDDIAWSLRRDRYFALLAQLANLRSELQSIHLPELRYSSQLAGRLPATTVLYASIPNLGDYLAQAQSTLNRRIEESPELREWWSTRSAQVAPIVDKLRAASEYLGDEIVIAGAAAAGPHGMGAPVFLAQVTRPGFAEFLLREAGPVPLETRNGFAVFGPDRAAVEALAPALDTSAGGFAGTPFYARIAEAYRNGAGLLLCVDLSRVSPGDSALGLRYLVAEQKEVNHQPETRATLGFDASNTGIGSWLAAPAPMGALDYISPDATVLAAFVVRMPADIVSQVTGVARKTPAEIGAEGDIAKDLAASLGGEFALSLDGPAFPVPSWKLVIEAYDPARFQSALQRLIAAANLKMAQTGRPPLRTAQETVNGHTYYMLGASTPNPLTEAHYTFVDGYLVAGPTRAMVSRALEVKQSRVSIMRSSKFVDLTPRDHYTNFSAVFYQNLGTTLAPLAGLLGGLGPQTPQQQRAIQQLSNIKPILVALYAEPDRITLASDGDAFGMSIANLLTGNPGGWAAGLTPFTAFSGTGARKPAYIRK